MPPIPNWNERHSSRLKKPLASNPDLAEAYLARAQLTWNLRNGFPHERAIADLRRAIVSNPNLAEAHVELGKLYFHIGLIPESIAANEEAVRLDPRASDVVTNRLVGATSGQWHDRVGPRRGRPKSAVAGAVTRLRAGVPGHDRRRDCRTRATRLVD